MHANNTMKTVIIDDDAAEVMSTESIDQSGLFLNGLRFLELPHSTIPLHHYSDFTR